MFKKLIYGTLFSLLLFSYQLTYAILPGFTSVIYFGDSLTDQGNGIVPPNIPCVTVSAPITNPIGGTNPGNVWANIQSQGFTAVPSRINPQAGNDWAVEGAETNNMLYQQIPNYLQIHGGFADPTALYVIWGGANDILDKIFNPNPNQRVAPGVVIEQGMTNILQMLTVLYNAGARNFLVIGEPNIGQAPIASSTDPRLKFFLVGSLLAQQTQVTEASVGLPGLPGWNTALFSRINAAGQSPLFFFKQTHANANIYTWDPNELLGPAIANPPAFGFPATINGFPNNQEISCPVTGVVNPDNFIFFNFLHPTSKSHTLIATYLRLQAQLF